MWMCLSHCSLSQPARPECHAAHGAVLAPHPTQIAKQRSLWRGHAFRGQAAQEDRRVVYGRREHPAQPSKQQCTDENRQLAMHAVRFT